MQRASVLDPDLNRVRALIIDDDPNLRRVLARTLSEWGAEVVEVENGARGIVELKRARDEGNVFRLIFADTTLSGVNGFEVAEHLREHPAELSGTIVMLGASGLRHDTERAQEIGVGGVLRKPLDRPSLVAAVESALGILARHEVGRSPETRPDRVRVLLAEDSRDASALVSHYLDRREFQVDAAENGSIALDLFRLAQYDIVLMDIQMPVLDGYRATQAMRSWERQHNRPRTPIIAVTAYAETEDAVKCLRAGFDGYLTKPLRKETLLTAIRRYLRPRQTAAPAGSP